MLDEARAHYYQHSGSASSVARQLAFAGIAAVWILVTDNGVVSVDGRELRTPLVFFMLTLFLDGLQYYSLAAFWGAFGWVKERKGETEFSGAPSWLNWLGIGCFWLKGAAVGVGYFLVIGKLWSVFLV